jgi:thiol:disulfide interchange protein DsbA
LAKRKPDKRLATIRNAVIAFVALIVVCVGGYGLFRSTAIDIGDEFVEGTHYRVIAGAPAVPDRGPIRVTEFFSYGCVHCRNFDPIVVDWLQTAPKDVKFDRIPVTFQPLWRELAQDYYTLESTNALAENHDRIFKAIHDNGKQFLSPEIMADFVAGHGITREEFLRVFGSPATAHAMAIGEQRERRSTANSVPTLMVADHYLVNMDSVPRKRAFDVVNFLLSKIRTDRAALAASAAAASPAASSDTAPAASPAAPAALPAGTP